MIDQILALSPDDWEAIRLLLRVMLDGLRAVAALRGRALKSRREGVT